MGLLDSLLKSTVRSVERSVERTTRKTVNQAEQKVANQVGNSIIKTVENDYHAISRDFTFDTLPTTLAELKALQKNPADPFEICALAVLALNAYENNPQEFALMMDFLNGPDEVANRDLQLVQTQFAGAGAKYTVKAYFKGATPENNYTPSMPYTITVHDNIYSYQNQNSGYISLFIPSGGADSDRQVTVRFKASTNEWFINNWQGLLMSIKTANEANPWA